MTANDLNAPAWSDPRLRKRYMIDLLCRDYEELWQAGHQPDLCNFVRNIDADLHEDLLPELVAAEWELRTLAGQRPSGGSQDSGDQPAGKPCRNQPI
jgi:hypothetical protein